MNYLCSAFLLCLLRLLLSCVYVLYAVEFKFINTYFIFNVAGSRDGLSKDFSLWRQVYGGNHATIKLRRVLV